MHDNGSSGPAASEEDADPTVPRGPGEERSVLATVKEEEAIFTNDAADKHEE